MPATTTTCQYQNEEFNTLYEELSVTTDEARRNAIFGDLQRMLAEDAAVGFLFPVAQDRRLGCSHRGACGRTGRWPLPISARSAGPNRPQPGGHSQDRPSAAGRRAFASDA